MSLAQELLALEDQGEFIRRHIGPSEAEIAAMLEAVGCRDLAELLARTVPAAIRGAELAALPAPASEAGAIAELRALSERNQQRRSLIGMGYHGTHTPPVILRNILENPGWYTQYTPYQAEISQGRMEALLNYQTLVLDLTGLQVANSSLLDEATAAAEARIAGTSSCSDGASISRSMSAAERLKKCSIRPSAVSASAKSGRASLMAWVSRAVLSIMPW